MYDSFTYVKIEIHKWNTSFRVTSREQVGGTKDSSINEPFIFRRIEKLRESRPYVTPVFEVDLRVPLRTYNTFTTLILLLIFEERQDLSE